jgi:hypothetical protein
MIKSRMESSREEEMVGCCLRNLELQFGKIKTFWR